MTGSRVAFDTWAWWEVLRGSPTGRLLQTKFLSREEDRVVTSTITLGELSAKLAAQGDAQAIPLAAASVEHRSEMVDLTADLALEAGRLRAELRKTHASASLADAIILATARRRGARLLSVDPAFKGQTDVGAV